MSRPKISIIIPVYNHSQQLVECLESIKHQTFQDIELIIVNDGSTDVSYDAIESITHKIIPQAKIIHQKNQGAPIARNNGFKHSLGQYIIFCDADVVMKPDMLSKMAQALDENPDISYVYSSFKFGFKKFKLWEFSAEKLREMPYIHTTSLMRREHFLGFDLGLKRLQDWDLWLTMLEKGYRGQWISQMLFTIKPGGTMSAWLPSFLAKQGLGKKSQAYQRAIQTVRKKHS